MQKVDFYADMKDIEYDGTIAWMIVENDVMPKPCNARHTMVIQAVR